MFSQNNSSSNLLSTKLQALMLKAVRQFAQKKHYQLSATEEHLFVQKISKKVLPQWELLANKKMNANPLTLFLALTKRSLKEIGNSINNHFDQELLDSQSSYLVTKYQPLVAYLTVTITSGNIDYEDVIQTVNENFLQKVHTGKLQTQYKGNATIRTFLNRVLRNLVIDCLRAMKNRSHKNVDIEINPDITPKSGFDMSLLAHNPIFQEHLKGLEQALKLFKKRNRFEFCLKVIYRLLLNSSSIRRDYPNCSDDLLVEILSIFVKDYTHLSQGKLYQILYQFICQLEGLHSKGSVGSLRKWFDRHRVVLWQQIFDNNLQDLGKDEKRMKDWYFEMLVYHYYA